MGMSNGNVKGEKTSNGKCQMKISNGNVKWGMSNGKISNGKMSNGKNVKWDAFILALYEKYKKNINTLIYIILYYLIVIITKNYIRENHGLNILKIKNKKKLKNKKKIF